MDSGYFGTCSSGTSCVFDSIAISSDPMRDVCRGIVHLDTGYSTLRSVILEPLSRRRWVLNRCTQDPSPLWRKTQRRSFGMTSTKRRRNDTANTWRLGKQAGYQVEYWLLNRARVSFSWL